MGNQNHIYASWCHNNGITIYPKVVAYCKYKLVINNKGRERVGEIIYNAQPENKWGEAIQELYKKYYDLNFNKTTKNEKNNPNV